MMEMTREQREAVDLRGVSICLEAGAGSGKTRVLTERILHLIRAGSCRSEEVVAITFTEKASLEMEGRLQSAFQEGETLPLITTIHGLCAIILRQYPYAVGIDPLFQIMDESAALILLERVIRETVSESVQGGGAGIDVPLLVNQFGYRGLKSVLHASLAKEAEWRSALSAIGSKREDYEQWSSRLLREKGEEALESFLSDPRLKAIGKELEGLGDHDEKRPLEQRRCALVKLLSLSPGGGEGLREQIRRIPELWDLRGRDKSWGDEEYLGLKSAIGELRGLFDRYEPWLTWQWDGAVERKAAETYESLCRLFERVCAAYQREKRKRNSLTFDDLQTLALDLLRRRGDLLAQLRARWKCIFVDECQDIDLRQRELIRLLASDGGLFVVGDPRQSIYRFRGADVELFSDLKSDLVDSGGQSLELCTNFRSSPSLVDWCNVVFSNVEGDPIFSRPMQLEAPSCGEDDDAKAILWTRAPAHFAEMDALERRKEEAAEVARLIQHLVQRGEASFGDVAILLRAMTHVTFYERELALRGIPYFTTAGSGFYTAPEIRDLISVMRLICEKGDDLDSFSALRSPYFSISPSDLLMFSQKMQGGLAQSLISPSREPQATREPLDCDRGGFSGITQASRLVSPTTVGETRSKKNTCFPIKLGAGFLAQSLSDESLLATLPEREREELHRAAETLKRWREESQRRSGAEMLEEICTQALLRRPDAFDERARANLDKLIHLARGVKSVDLADFLEFLEELDLQGAESGEFQLESEAAHSVKILTIHKSKGLEFPVVILPQIGSEVPRETFPTLFDRQGGIGVACRDVSGERFSSVGYEWLRSLSEKNRIAESRRLLYVACTRAEKRLILPHLFIEEQKPKEKSWASWLVPFVHLRSCQEMDSSSVVTSQKVDVFFPLRASEASREAARFAPVAKGFSTRLVASLARTRTKEAPQAIEKLQKLQLSVSQLMDYRRCPLKYQLKFVHHIPEVAGKTRGMQGDALFGSVMHALLQQWDYEKESIPFLWDRIRILFSPQIDSMKKSCLSLLGEIVHSPLLEMLHSAPLIKREEFFVLVGENYRLEGVMDLLLLNGDGEWEIVDFKTNLVEKEKLHFVAGGFQFQLDCYAYAVEKMTGGRVSATHLAFLRTGDLISEKINGERLERVAREIDAIARDIGAGKFDPRPGSHCPFCGFKEYCYPESWKKDTNFPKINIDFWANWRDSS